MVELVYPCGTNYLKARKLHLKIVVCSSRCERTGQPPYFELFGHLHFLCVFVIDYKRDFTLQNWRVECGNDSIFQNSTFDLFIYLKCFTKFFFFSKIIVQSDFIFERLPDFLFRKHRPFLLAKRIEVFENFSSSNTNLS